MAPIKATNPYISTSHAARILKRHNATVLRYAYAGLLGDYHQLEGSTSTFLFDRANVEKLARRIKADPHYIRDELEAQRVDRRRAEAANKAASA